MWFLIWLASFGFMEAEIEYKDGLKLKFRNIWKRKP